MPNITIQLPTTDVARGGYRFDPKAVRQACELLGLHRPVRIRFSAGTRTAGCYRYRSGEHHITVSGLYGVAEAGRYLWHELTHAAQRDARTDGLGPTEVSALHTRYKRSHGYRNSPHEVEARSMEAFNEDLPLAVPARYVAPKPRQASYPTAGFRAW